MLMEKKQRERIKEEKRLAAEAKKDQPPVDPRFKRFEAVHKQARKDAENEYKMWVAETREKTPPMVVSRPVSAPNIAACFDSLVRKKVEAGNAEMHQRHSEYASWLKTIQWARSHLDHVIIMLRFSKTTPPQIRSAVMLDQRCWVRQVRWPRTRMVVASCKAFLNIRARVHFLPPLLVS